MEQTFRRVCSGQATGLFAGVVRAALRTLEPIYSAIVNSRNTSYARGVLKTVRADRPVISVGNLTTGGTGKTPVVRWLAERFREAGVRPAILMRGYKSAPGERSDEQNLLNELLNPPGAVSTIPVHADADRYAGAIAVLRQHPDVQVIILDDGFQHRRLHRDFDLVLIDATNPFGFDHVLPRGLLREPLHGLRRATAVLLTRVDQALPTELDQIGLTVKRMAPSVPVYQSIHAHAALLFDDGGTELVRPVNWLNEKRVVSFCAIGNPEAFERQLKAAGAILVGHHAFADHHAYSESDLTQIRARARTAEAIITTEKDWVKVARLRNASSDSPPIGRVRLKLGFVGNDGVRLFDQIRNSIWQQS